MRMILLAALMVFLLAGCSGDANNGNSNGEDKEEDKSIDAYIRDFREAGTITYQIVSNTSFKDHAQNKLSMANFTFTRAPFTLSSIAVNETGRYPQYFKSQETFSGTTLTTYKAMAEIDPTAYTLDEDGIITIKQEPENLMSLINQTNEDMPLSTKDFLDPFHMLLALIERNLDSFEMDFQSLLSSSEPRMVYKGEIQPDTLVDYFTHEGGDIFKEVIFWNYQGEITREALRDDIIKNGFGMSFGLMPILFSEEPIQVSFSKRTVPASFGKSGDIYEIVIDMTPAQQSLFKAMYESQVQTYNVELTEAVVKYTNIRLER